MNDSNDYDSFSSGVGGSNPNDAFNEGTADSPATVPLLY